MFVRLLPFALLFSCACGDAPSIDREAAYYARQQRDVNGLRIDARESMSLAAAAEILDAIHSDLVESGLCKGGEPIQVGLRASAEHPRVFESVYRVQHVLQMYRLAYVQLDGLVLLADGLSWRDVYTRGSTHPLLSDEFDKLYAASPIQVRATVATGLSPRRAARHAERKERLRHEMEQP